VQKVAGFDRASFVPQHPYSALNEAWKRSADPGPPFATFPNVAPFSKAIHQTFKAQGYPGRE
jgi:hypothetical protein